jgi:hypothetical protein
MRDQMKRPGLDGQGGGIRELRKAANLTLDEAAERNGGKG